MTTTITRSYTRQFCKDNALLKPYSEKSYCNVLWLDNGKAFVPRDLWPEFIHAVSADEMVSGSAEHSFSYACEKPPLDPMSARRLVFDLDFESSSSVSDEYIQNVFVALGKTLEACFPWDDYKVMYSVILTSPIKKIKTGAYKNGYHVSVINAILTLHQCYQVRALFISYLIEHFGGDRDGPLENGFEDVVDNHIYKNGLRLPGSCKGHKCKKCSKSSQIDCQICDGKGFIHEGRPYSLEYIIDSRGKVLGPGSAFFDFFSYQYGLAQQMDCVTMNAPFKKLVTTFNYPEDGPQPYPEKKKGKKTSAFKNLTDKKLWEKEFKKTINTRFRSSEQIMQSMPVFKDIVQLVQSSSVFYKNINVSQIQRNASSGDYIINVTGRGCHSCFIKGVEEKTAITHNSNRIWFILSKKKNTLFQYCFSEKCKKKNHVLSNPSPFQKHVLFPIEKQSAGIKKSIVLQNKRRKELLSLLSLQQKVNNNKRR